jgi:hypothetical protein
MEPEFVLMIGMVEFESAQILIIHGDAVHAPRAGGGDRHHSTVDLVSFMAPKAHLSEPHTRECGGKTGEPAGTRTQGLALMGQF